MKDKHALVHYAINLPLAAFALALLTQTGTGTLPVYTPALVLSEATPLSFGLWSILFGVIFLVTKSLFNTSSVKIGLPELGSIIFLGLLIDFWSILFRNLSQASFASHVFCIILACFLLAIVTVLQNELRTFTLPSDALTESISQRYMHHLSNRFQLLDIICLVLGLLLSFIIFQEYIGIGIATFVPPFLIPYFVSLLQKGLLKLQDSEFF